jgi:hypothetical protein
MFAHEGHEVGLELEHLLTAARPGRFDVSRQREGACSEVDRGDG